MDGLVEECKKFLDMLSLVGLSAEKMTEACKIADYDHSHRLYDPVTQMVYDTKGRPPPQNVDKKSLWCDALYHSGANAKALPEGVMEHELTECLLTMDSPTVKSDHFAMMKRMRLMDQRLQKVEARVEEGITEILQLLKADRQ